MARSGAPPRFEPMKRRIATTVALGCLGVAGAAAGTTARLASAIDVGKTVLLAPRTKSSGCHLGANPDRRCSPGAYYTKLTRQVICAADFRTGAVRNVPAAEKFAVEREYGLAPRRYGRTLEIDRLQGEGPAGERAARHRLPRRDAAANRAAAHRRELAAALHAGLRRTAHALRPGLSRVATFSVDPGPWPERSLAAAAGARDHRWRCRWSWSAANANGTRPGARPRGRVTWSTSTTTATTRSCSSVPAVPRASSVASRHRAAVASSTTSAHRAARVLPERRGTCVPTRFSWM